MEYKDKKTLNKSLEKKKKKKAQNDKLHVFDH